MTASTGSLRIADIIVSTTDHPISGVIRTGTGASVSHAMLYLGNLEVIEAVGEGVRRGPLSLALADATLAIVLRRRGLSEATAAEVVRHAVSFQDRPYDKVGAVGSGAALGRGAALAGAGCLLSLRMCSSAVVEVLRNASPSKRDEAFFCSELVARSFELAGAPIVDGSASYASPRAIRISPHLYFMGRLR